MDELVQDLVCALDESELKINVKNLSETSVNSTVLDRERKRKTRKRRTTSISSHLNNSNGLNNFFKSKHLSDYSNSSSDEPIQEYFGNWTTNNYSAESDEKIEKMLYKRHRNNGSSHKEHVHRKMNHIREPVIVESDSYTENGVVPLNISKKLRKKRNKKMNIEITNDGFAKSMEILKNGKQRFHKHAYSYPHRNGSEVNMECQIKAKTTNVINLFSKTIKPLCAYSIKTNNEDAYSGSSLSDNDSGNLSNDDVGREGDDEMTDFYADPDDNSSICGIPTCRINRLNERHNMYFLHQNHKQMAEDMDTALMENKLREIYNGAPLTTSENMERGFHSRINRLPGLAARSIRRGRRRSKLKKLSNSLTGAMEKPEGDNTETKSLNVKRRKVDDGQNENGFDFIQAYSLISNRQCSVGRHMLFEMGWPSHGGNPQSSTDITHVDLCQLD